MDMTAHDVVVPREMEGKSLFIDGDFSDRIWRGDQPKYGYPKNHVPEATIPSMTVETGFIAALKADKA